MTDERVLDPIDRISEVLFGLFMVLTFTGTLSVASAGREDVKTMLATAIGCNTAWGFVDGVMFVLRNLVERGRKASLARAVLGATSTADAHRLIGEAIGPLAEGLDPPAVERVRKWLGALPASALPRAALRSSDIRGAVAIFLLVFASTFPVVLPFVLFADLKEAMRASGAVAVAMMFGCGYVWGRYADFKPWRSGLVMVLLGVAIELVIIALGG